MLRSQSRVQTCRSQPSSTENRAAQPRNASKGNGFGAQTAARAEYGGGIF